jgi:hypothetical protein
MPYSGPSVVSMGKALYYPLTSDCPNEQRLRYPFAFISMVVVIKGLDGHLLMSRGVRRFHPN